MRKIYFATLLLSMTLQASAQTTDNLHTQRQTLKDLVVKGQRPMLKAEKGMLVYDLKEVAKTSLVTSAYDCLTALPGVMEKDEKLTYLGSHKITVIFNGKVSTMTQEQLFQLLKSMPASKVVKAEVMQAAPARYHVKGAAINLVTRKYRQGEGGLQGEVKAGYTQEQKASGNGGLTLSYVSPHWEWDVLYNANFIQKRSKNDIHTHHVVNEVAHDIDQSIWMNSRHLSHTAHGGLTYKWGKDNHLSLAYNGTFTAPDGKNNTNTEGNLFQSHSNKVSDSKLHNVSLDFNGLTSLKAGVDYTRYLMNNTQYLANTSQSAQSSAFDTYSTQRIDRLHAYIDHSTDLNKVWSLDYGTSFNYAKSHNAQLFKGKPDEDDTNSDIHEYTYNLYGGFSAQLSQRLSLDASLALEYYKMENYQKWALYPTLNLSYTAAPQHIFQLSFTSDKYYPTYWELSGSTSYEDGYTEIHTNPYLKPEVDYTASLQYIFKQKYVLSVSYDYDKNYFTQMAYLDSRQLRLLYNTNNWDYHQELSITAVVPFKVGTWWNGQITLQATRMHDKASHYYDAPFDHKSWQLFGQAKQVFNLCTRPNIQLELSGMYVRGAIQGSYNIHPVGKVDTALRYTFLKGNAILQVKGNDLFDTMHATCDFTQGKQRFVMENSPYSRTFEATFIYRFGGFKEKKIKKPNMSRFGN